MDRIVQMKRNSKSPQSIFQEMGKARWTPFDAFAVKTKLGATLLLSANTDAGVPSAVHIDEIEVPESLRRRGVATKAMTALCRLADKYQFHLEGGPIGLSCDPWRDKFVEWMLRFGFKADPRFADTPIDDQNAFFVRRLPKTRCGVN
jgi:hypothetical protein